jgi:hypothetical protein
VGSQELTAWATVQPDQVVATTGAEDANYTGRKVEKYEKWGLKINFGINRIFRYTSIRGTAYQ